MKRIFLIFVFLTLTSSFSLFLPKSIKAATTFNCSWSNADPNNQCSVDAYHQDCGSYPVAGSPEQKYCNQFDNNMGNCDQAQGYCFTCNSPNKCFSGACPNGYDPSDGRCVDPSQVCCLQQGQPPPPVTKCYACVISGFNNYCTIFAPNPQGSCDPNWSDEVACTQACVNGTGPMQYNCDLQKNPSCIPVQKGQYGSASECLNNCVSTDPNGIKCDKDTGIKTAIGCIHVLSTPEAFLSDILKWAVGVGGGIAFLLVLYAGFMIMTASGNPERLKAGQELLTSAISGLILLIFSIFILKFIGVDILGLYKFGFGTYP